MRIKFYPINKILRSEIPNCLKNYLEPCTLNIFIPALVAQLVECLLQGTGFYGFDPGLQHTKVTKNGTSCSSLGTQTYRVELGLVDPASG